MKVRTEEGEYYEDDEVEFGDEYELTSFGSERNLKVEQSLDHEGNIEEN